MTPEEARELLDGTVPGPWLCDKDGDEYEFVIGTGDFGIITEVDRESDGRLIAAAPALAETIADMDWEYAVQEFVGYWRERGSGFSNAVVARRFLDMKQEDAPMRIVRRLATDWEVVE